MDLLILGPPMPWGSPRYRGASRTSPSYCSELPKEHEVNRLILWYFDEGGETEVVHDLGRAVRLAELAEATDPSKCFDVVEACRADSKPQASGQLLGFDLCQGFGNSLLVGDITDIPADADEDPSLKVFVELITAHFRPRLNVHGLFDERTDALFCLRCMDAAQRLRPSLYEGEDLIPAFEPLALYLVRPGASGPVGG